MSLVGLCTSIECDNQIKPLYECHCCSNLICFNHLHEHVKIEKDQFDHLSKMLTNASISLQLNIENKLKRIEKEKELLQRVNHLLNEQFHPIIQMENILQEINQLNIEENIIKVEPSFLDKSISQNDIEYTFSDNQHIAESVSLDRIEDSILFTNENCSNLVSLRSYNGLCPLTFNGAFGLNKFDHSIYFCSKTKVREINLYYHFINKHQLKKIYVERLMKAIENNLDPKTTNLFNSNDDVIDHLYRLKCPFTNGIIDLFNLNENEISHIPCRSKRITLPGLKGHLKKHHGLSESLANKLAKYLKDNQIKN